MNPEVEIRITIRDGTTAIGGVGAFAAAGAPQPDPQMGAAGMAAAGIAAPSPMEAAGAQAAAPTPMTAGGMAAAATTPPQPVPVDQIEQLGSSAAVDGASAAPTPEGAGS
jgi:hypothetical protein